MAKSFFPTLLSAFKGHHDSQGNKIHVLVCMDSVIGLPEWIKPAAVAVNPITEQNVEMVELNISAGACTPIQYVEDGMRTSMRFKGEERHLYIPYQNIAIVHAFNEGFSDQYQNNDFELPAVESSLEKEFVAPQTEADKKRAKMRLV